MNHIHKDIKDLMSVIITQRNNISGGDIVFYDRVNMRDLRKIYHVRQNILFF